MRCASPPLSRGCRTIKRQIVQSHVLEEPQARVYLLQYLPGDRTLPQIKRRLAFLGVQPIYPLHGLADGGRRHLYDVSVCHGDRQRLGLEALALAVSAGPGGHVPLDLLAHVVGSCLAVASLQVGDHALEPGIPGVDAAPVRGGGASAPPCPGCRKYEVHVLLIQVPHPVLDGEAVGPPTATPAGWKTRDWRSRSGTREQTAPDARLASLLGMTRSGSISNR